MSPEADCLLPLYVIEMTEKALLQAINTQSKAEHEYCLRYLTGFRTQKASAHGIKGMVM